MMYKLNRRILTPTAVTTTLFGLGVHTASAVIPPPHTDPANAGNWILRTDMSDEFDTGSLDHAKWQVCGKDDVFWAGHFKGRTYNTANTGGVPGGWQYSPDNIRVENGMLKITTQYEPDYDWYQPGSDVWTHTTAGMWSKATVTSGYMEIRCKLAYEEQTGAFWTTGSGSELDVFEAIGKHSARQNKMWSSVHDWQFNGWPNDAWTDTKDLPFDFSDGFHTYSAEWDTNSLQIYADGQLIHSVTKAWVEANGTHSKRWPLTGGQHVWADSEIFDWWGVPDPDNPPSDFEVEYIRVWQKGPPIVTPTLWQQFVADFGLSGVKTNHADDDILNDWGEYVFNGNPTNPADMGIAPSFDAASGEYTFLVKNDDSLVAYIVSSTNMTAPTWFTNEAVDITVNDGAMGTHVRTIGTSELQLFMKLMVDEGTINTNMPPTGTNTTVIIGGSTGNGDFNAVATGSGTLPYSNSPRWFNASGSENANFTSTSLMNGSSDPSNTPGAISTRNVVQVNSAGYTVTATDETFSLKYEFGASGGPAGWDGSTVHRTFLFTADAAVDANLTTGNITEIAANTHVLNVAIQGQWTIPIFNNFYTTTAGDIGKTLYFGMAFQDPDGSNNGNGGRIDVIELEVHN